MYALQRPDGTLFKCGPIGQQEVQLFYMPVTAKRWAKLLTEDGEGPLICVPITIELAPL